MLSVAMEEIKRSQLGKAAKVNALTLLDLAHADNGHVMITWRELAELWGIAESTSRRHLGDLQTANILHYSTNGDGQTVYINFKAWVKTRVGARKSSSDATENARGIDENRAPTRDPAPDDSGDDQKSRVGARKTRVESTKNARGRALSAPDLTRAHAGDLLEGRKEGITDPQILPSFPRPASREEAARSRQLLLDVRLAPKHANELAGSIAFEVIRDRVAAWWMNRKSVGGTLYDGPGIVYNWLTNPDSAAPNSYIEADWKRTELYQRYRTLEEIAADEAPPPVPPPRPRTPVPEASPYLDEDPVWRGVAQDPRFGDLLAGLIRVDHVDGTPCYVLAARDPGRIEWLQRATALRRLVTSAGGQQVLMEIVPPLEGDNTTGPDGPKE